MSWKDTVLNLRHELEISTFEMYINYCEFYTQFTEGYPKICSDLKTNKLLKIHSVLLVQALDVLLIEDF